MLALLGLLLLVHATALAASIHAGDTIAGVLAWQAALVFVWIFGACASTNQTEP